MKILLVIPPVFYLRQPHIGVAYIASFLKKYGYETKVMDLNTEFQINNDGDDAYWSLMDNGREFYYKNLTLFNKLIQEILDYDPQIIGFSVYSTTLFFSLKLALRIKKIDKKKLIVFGGYLCNVQPEEIFNYPQVDILVLGEGEVTMLEIVREFEKKNRIEYVPGTIFRYDGKIINCGRRDEFYNLDELPFPDFSDFKLERYLYRYHIPIIFSRGCSWRCSFCTVFKSWQKFRKRTADNIYKEILFRLQQYPITKQFEICEPAFNQDLELISRLSEFIITDRLNIKFSGMAQIRTEITPELLDKMRKAGFSVMNYGIESGSSKILKLMRKNYTPEEAERVIRDTYNAGIDVVANFIVGFPGEMEEDFYQTLKFIEKNKRYFSNIAPAHECDIKYTEIYSNPKKYNVYIPQVDEYVRFWRTLDGSNDFKEREKRKKIFDKFVRDLGITLRCGQDDRRYEYCIG